MNRLKIYLLNKLQGASANEFFFDTNESILFDIVVALTCTFYNSIQQAYANRKCLRKTSVALCIKFLHLPLQLVSLPQTTQRKGIAENLRVINHKFVDH